MDQCHETECGQPAAWYVEVKALDGGRDLAGFTIPACEKHAQEIAEVVEGICEGAEVSVQIVPLGGSEYPPVVSDE